MIDQPYLDQICSRYHTCLAQLRLATCQGTGCCLVLVPGHQFALMSTSVLHCHRSLQNWRHERDGTHTSTSGGTHVTGEPATCNHHCMNNNTSRPRASLDWARNQHGDSRLLSPNTQGHNPPPGHTLVRQQGTHRQLQGACGISPGLATDLPGLLAPGCLLQDAAACCTGRHPLRVHRQGSLQGQ
jgi:hypothetical protein